MKPINAYKYCLLCGSPLQKEVDGSLQCTKCGHRHYLNPLPCNAAIIENDQGEILLVERAIDPYKGKWDLPGGFLKSGEDFPSSLKREVHEELGCEIKIGRIIGAYSDEYPFQGITYSTLGIVAHARIVSGEVTPADDVSDYAFFAKSKVLAQDIAFSTIRQALKDYLSPNERDLA